MSATEQRAPRPASGLTAAIERALLVRLRYGLFWLITACALYVSLTLTLIQTRHPDAFKAQPLQPVAGMMLIVEGALLLTALLMAQLASRPGLTPAGAPGRLASSLAGSVMLLIQFALQITPLLIIYRAPEMAIKGIHVPLILLQRGLLLCLCAFMAYHLLLALRLQLRLPTAAAFGLTLALYLWGTYALIKLSLSSDTFQRLNDTFYWNQLPLHLNSLPKLGTDHVVANIDAQYLLYYILLGIGGCIVTLILWIPGAIRTDARETRERENIEQRPSNART